MEKKIFVIIIALSITTTSYIAILNDFEVKATPGGDGGDIDDIGLDFDWMWDYVIKDMCNATYIPYKGLKILRGREFGTNGEHWAADKIEEYMSLSCGLKNVKPIQLLPINNDVCKNRFYTTRLNVTDYKLHIDIDSEDYHIDIPVNESFVIPMALPKDRLLNDLTFNWNLPEEDNIVIRLDKYTDWPLGGSFTNYSCYNLSINITNDPDILIGNATYIEDGDPLPEDIQNRVFIFNENQTTESDLENVTNSSGVLLIHEYNAINTITNETTAKYNYSICRVENNEGNLNNILDGLENEPMMVDNAIDNKTLTFTKNLSNANPADSDYVLLSQKIEGKKLLIDLTFLYGINIVNNLWDGTDCKGVIGYQTKYDNEQENRSHYMNKHQLGPFKGGWFRDKPFSDFNDSKYLLWRVFPSPALPIFCVNYSIGNCLYENRSEALISGYENQEHHRELHIGEEWTPGVTAYNVIGNLTNDGSDNPPDPDDPIILISNRFDGWWCEAAFDSGCGTGVVLAIAKYFKDHNITPKVNITFLETTGEEYLFRGAQHYSDSHPNMNFSHWIGFDQLASDWKDTVLEIMYNDETVRDIGENISKELGYPKRTNKNYSDDHFVDFGLTGCEDSVWKERHLEPVYGGIDCDYECKTICFSRKSDDRIRHRRGEMKDGEFTAGDIKENIDREDLNDTLEMAWNITKYFCVNPNCWFNESGWNYTISDSNDNCSYNDTVHVEFDVRSTLPQDKVMINISLGTYGEQDSEPVMYKNIKSTVNRTWKTLNVNFTLPENETPGHYKLKFSLYNSTGCIDEIINPFEDNFNVTKISDDPFFLYPENYCGIPPNISSVSVSDDTVGYGFNVTINADVYSTVGSNIDIVSVNMSYPDFTIKSFNMTNTVNDTYEYVFNDTWKYGTYQFVIWTRDENNNVSGSKEEFTFNVSGKATISVCTIKDSYGASEIVNLTDPPCQSGNNPQDIGYTLLDDGNVLHIWNKYDNYYFNTSNGIQLTNHKDEYWSHNVLMLGYYNNDIWNLLYRTDELSNFNKNIISDNETCINITLWKDLTYGGYDFRLAIRYYLGVNDNELTVIPYIKNLGEDDIPYDLGFAWELKDIQIDMTTGGDYIDIDGNSYYLNQTLDETYTDMDPACFYISEDITDTMSKSLYLRWDKDLAYKVTVKSRDGQYNAPVTLFIKVGTLNAGQEKYTSIFWYDADQMVYYFDGYNESWMYNPGYMVDGNENTYASTTSFLDVELCDNNTCNGSYLGIISKVELRCKGYYTGMPVDIILRPVYNGDTEGDDYTFDAPTGSGNWSEWFDITNSEGSMEAWSWSDAEELDCEVQPSFGLGMYTLFCSMVELRITYNTNYAPEVSDPYPADESTGISIAPVLNITVYDADSDIMNISWLSNSSGSWLEFASNNNVGNGVYNQTFSNASENGQWWYWRVNVSDGANYTISDVYSFFTGFESKIQNTGNLNMSGYLFIRVDFYNTSSEEWELETNVIDEKFTTRIINVSETLALDTIFNPENVNTSSFSHGNGTYRVYAALRDPYGNVLYVCDNSQYPPIWWYLMDSYEFTVTGL